MTHAPVMTEKLTVAVVGYGYWGPNLVRNCFEHPQIQLKAVCDLDPGKQARVTERYPSVHVTGDYQSLLNDPSIQAIVIATPVHSHYPLAMAALEAGKHVLVEKPMAMNTLQCRELIALAKAKDLTLMVDHTFVYHGAIRRMKQEIQVGNLGELLYFDSMRVNLGLFQSDVNVIWDLATHDLAIMDYLIDVEPVSVHAIGTAAPGREQIAVAYLSVKFANNVMAHFNVSWLSPVKIRQVLVGGTQKMMVYNDLEPMEKIRIYDKGITLTEVDDEQHRYQSLVGYRMGDMMAPMLDQTEALKLEVDHFVQCVLNGQRPLTDGNSGLRVVQILEAADESLRTGQIIELQPELSQSPALLPA